jgi:hypothetical protein
MTTNTEAVDGEMAKFLSGVVGVVEADSYAQHMLWAENRRREKPLKWTGNSRGLMETIGNLGGMPVCVSLFTAEIDGHKLLFIDATSQVVDHRMIDGWLKKTMPPSAFRKDGYINRTDATNFHNVFPD